MKKKIYAAFTASPASLKAAETAALTGADGLVLRDLSENDAEHDAFMGFVRSLARVVDAPILSGGRTKRLEDIKKYLYAGSAAAFLDSEKEADLPLVAEGTDRFGKGKVWFTVNSSAQFSLMKTAVRNGAAGIIFEEAAVPFCENCVPDDFQGDLLVSVSGDYEAVKEAMLGPGTGIVLTAKEGEEIDYMALKAKLQADGIEVMTFEPAFTWADVKKDPQGLLPVVVQDYKTMEVLMVAYMNEEAWNKTLSTGRMTYWSRSRNELWLKGDTSGHFQFVKSLALDCDKDTLLAKVFQVGAACHTGAYSCFFNEVAAKSGLSKNPHRIFEDVYDVIMDRKEHPKEGSYTNYLFDKGIDKILKKVGEEATEIVIAAKNPDPEEIKYEIADFLYHVMVLMAERGVTWEDITQELANR